MNTKELARAFHKGTSCRASSMHTHIDCVNIGDGTTTPAVFATLAARNRDEMLRTLVPPDTHALTFYNLHSSCIAMKCYGGAPRLFITNAGYATRTTQARLNSLLQATHVGIRVSKNATEVAGLKLDHEFSSLYLIRHSREHSERVNAMHYRSIWVPLVSLGRL